MLLATLLVGILCSWCLLCWNNNQQGLRLCPSTYYMPCDQPPLDPSAVRVTRQYPPRAVHGLDWERCALLHNQIVETGCAAVHETSNLRPTPITWWAKYASDEAEAKRLRARLSPSLVLFLERAHVGVEGVAFFNYLRGLNAPEALWYWYEGEGEPAVGRYLSLYAATNFVGHWDGLAFDQQTHKCVLQMSIFDGHWTRENPQLWHPLETVLSAYLDMIDIGKSAPTDLERSLECSPWKLAPYSERQLDDTLAAFARLVQAIEQRMPDSTTKPHPSTPTNQTGLISDSVLQAANIPPGFARSFLTRAPLPRFRNIAPGLRLPLPSDFHPDPPTFQPPSPPTWHEELKHSTPPLHLFHSSTPCRGLSSTTLPGLWSCYTPPTTIRAGLYFSPCDRASALHAFEDGVRLFLPFALGRHAQARTSDGQRIPEAPLVHALHSPGVDACVELYQQGYNPFIVQHEVRLQSVLESWTGMVESGGWRVDGEGVAGGLEAFAEADEPWGWKGYQVPMSW